MFPMFLKDNLDDLAVGFLREMKECDRGVGVEFVTILSASQDSIEGALHTLHSTDLPFQEIISQLIIHIIELSLDTDKLANLSQLLDKLHDLERNVPLILLIQTAKLSVKDAKFADICKSFLNRHGSRVQFVVLELFESDLSGFYSIISQLYNSFALDLIGDWESLQLVFSMIDPVTFSSLHSDIASGKLRLFGEEPINYFLNCSKLSSFSSIAAWNLLQIEVLANPKFESSIVAFLLTLLEDSKGPIEASNSLSTILLGARPSSSLLHLILCSPLSQSTLVELLMNQLHQKHGFESILMLLQDLVGLFTDNNVIVGDQRRLEESFADGELEIDLLKKRASARFDINTINLGLITSHLQSSAWNTVLKS